MRQDCRAEMVRRAKEKKNGVYAHREWKYAVKDGFPVLFANRTTGHIFHHTHGFLVSAGAIATYAIDKELKRLLETL